MKLLKKTEIEGMAEVTGRIMSVSVLELGRKYGVEKSKLDFLRSNDVERIKICYGCEKISGKFALSDKPMMQTDGSCNRGQVTGATFVLEGKVLFVPEINVYRAVSDFVPYYAQKLEAMAKKKVKRKEALAKRRPVKRCSTV